MHVSLHQPLQFLRQVSQVIRSSSFLIMLEAAALAVLLWRKFTFYI
jgi:hypothetical protein